MKIGLISDTHSYLGQDVIDQIKDCDEIWHGGDIGNMGTAEAIEAIGPPVKMVWGNIDGRELRITYPRDLVWVADGLKVVEYRHRSVGDDADRCGIDSRRRPVPAAAPDRHEQTNGRRRRRRERRPQG